MGNVIKQQIKGHDVVFTHRPHAYTVDGRRVQSVTQIMKNQGIIDTRWFTKEGRIRGALVHEITAMIDLDCMDMVNTDRWDLFGYLFAWKLFCKEKKFVPEGIERMIYNEDGDYAGTYDRDGLMKKEPWLLDIKTGAHQRYHGLQLAGYAAGDELLAGYRRGIVHLRKNGKYYLCTGDRLYGEYDNPRWDRWWETVVNREVKAA